MRLLVLAMMPLLTMVLLCMLMLMVYLHQGFFFLFLGMMRVLVMMVFMILGSSFRLFGMFAFGFAVLGFIVGLEFTFDCDKEVIELSVLFFDFFLGLCVLVLGRLCALFGSD